MTQNLFVLKSFRGGLSDYENVGAYGSFKFGSNLDIRKDTDSLSCQQVLTDDLASGTMTGLALFIVNASDGNSYHFCRDGKIFKRTSAGTYTLVYTDAENLITGAAEWYNDVNDTFLYWTTATKLHRKRILGTGYTDTDWTDVDALVNGQVYPKTTLTSATWHTMAQIKGNLYIANYNTLAEVGWDDSFTNNALQLIPRNVSKCLMEYKTYGLIGTGGNKPAFLFGWDASQSLNWNTKEPLSLGVNALCAAEYPLMQCGDEGQLFLADINNYPQPLTHFPGGGSVDPDGVEVDRGMALFGVFGNGTGKSGIYSYGRIRKNDKVVLNLDHAFDCDEIGSVKMVGTTLLFSYKNVSSYGVKKVDTTLKSIGTYQSLDLIAPKMPKEPRWEYVRLVTASLPASCSIEVWRKIDKTGSFTQANLQGGGLTFTTTGGKEAIFLLGDTGKICEIKIILNPSENSCPEVFPDVEVYVA